MALDIVCFCVVDELFSIIRIVDWVGVVPLIFGVVLFVVF